MKIMMPKIVELIESSGLREKDQGFLKIHLETCDEYLQSVKRKSEVLQQFVDLIDNRASELTEKCVFLNVMMNEFHNRFTDEELNEIRAKVEESLKDAKKRDLWK